MISKRNTPDKKAKYLSCRRSDFFLIVSDSIPLRRSPRFSLPNIAMNGKRGRSPIRQARPLTPVPPVHRCHQRRGIALQHQVGQGLPPEGGLSGSRRCRLVSGNMVETYHAHQTGPHEKSGQDAPHPQAPDHELLRSQRLSFQRSRRGPESQGETDHEKIVRFQVTRIIENRPLPHTWKFT